MIKKYFWSKIFCATRYGCLVSQKIGVSIRAGMRNTLAAQTSQKHGEMPSSYIFSRKASYEEASKKKVV